MYSEHTRGPGDVHGRKTVGIADWIEPARGLALTPLRPASLRSPSAAADRWLARDGRVQPLRAQFLRAARELRHVQDVSFLTSTPDDPGANLGFDMSADPFALARFLQAQAPVDAQVRAELARGRKTSHWMWFIFPQLRGLGQSELARHYGISSRAEALAYREHAVLGPRLCEHTELVNQLQQRSLLDIFGTPDDLKFRSCMTLFQQVARPGDPFQAALARYCDGVPCPRTLALLA